MLCFGVQSCLVTTVTTVIPVTTVTTVTSQKNIYLFFSEHFWKEQFDTFDNRCDDLSAAFCDSRNVYKPTQYAYQDAAADL